MTTARELLDEAERARVVLLSMRSTEVEVDGDSERAKDRRRYEAERDLPLLYLAAGMAALVEIRDFVVANVRRPR